MDQTIIHAYLYVGREVAQFGDSNLYQDIKYQAKMLLWMLLTFCDRCTAAMVRDGAAESLREIYAFSARSLRICSAVRAVRVTLGLYGT